jgi:hypothetical protein
MCHGTPSLGLVPVFFCLLLVTPFSVGVTVLGVPVECVRVVIAELNDHVPAPRARHRLPPSQDPYESCERPSSDLHLPVLCGGGGGFFPCCGASFCGFPAFSPLWVFFGLCVHDLPGSPDPPPVDLLKMPTPSPHSCGCGVADSCERPASTAPLAATGRHAWSERCRPSCVPRCSPCVPCSPLCSILSRNRRA